MAPGTVAHLAVEFNLSALLGVKSDVLDGSAAGVVADPDSVDHLFIRHLQTTLELIALRVTAEYLCLCSVFEVHLDRADSLVDAACDSEEESLGHLDLCLLLDETVQVFRVAERILAHFIAATDVKLAKSSHLTRWA